MSGWEEIRRATAARIGLGRSGASLATAPALAFRLAHAQARDAVHLALDMDAMRAALPGDTIAVASSAPDRRTFLMRPDLGRALRPDDAARLQQCAAGFDLAVVVGDGLSAMASLRHAPTLLQALLPRLRDWAIAPMVVAAQARVALGDKVALALGARAVLMLLGERPGLSAPDSLGAYLTWAPGPRTSDADRNCVSNIRPDGLAPGAAAATIAFLLQRMRVLELSGVALKDESSALPRPSSPQ